MEIRRYLAQGKPLLFDGAMGTCYAALPAGRRLGASGPAWIIRRRSRPSTPPIWRRAAGPVKTNTFSVGVDRSQGTRPWLGS